MADIKWDHSAFRKSAHTKAMDGVEELARGPILTEAKEGCPVDGGTMRGSLGVERDDKNSRCYVGGGGAAAAYVYRQHQDMTLNHTTGHAKFISRAVEAHRGELKKYVEKHLNK
ncbi:hypothetical protein M0R72_18675 [Candidatus Pacearchaeota archaeon]|jgi:hypothetical protein|nr:hypothetical protein [Candidatus Pacearchaeota archaeon]